jgi:hypothetical protein
MDDMFRFYQVVLGSKISVGSMRQIAQNSINEVGFMKQGRRQRVIDFQKFVSVIDGISIHKKLTILY